MTRTPAPVTAPPDLVRLLLVASVALITIVAFENLAASAALPAVSAELDGLRLYPVAAGAPLAAQLVATAVAGRWADVRGPRPVLLLGLVLFPLGLLLAGTAPSMAVLAVGRGVQGLGGGLLIVPLYVLVGAIVPAARQPGFFAWFSAAWVVPALGGPALTGLVVDHASWRWVFLGAAALMAVVTLAFAPLLRHMPGRDAERAEQPAVRGLVLAATAAGAAVAVLQVAGSAQETWSLPAVGVAVVVLAVSLPRLLPSGTVRLRSGVPAAVACRALLNATFMTSQTFLPLLLVREYGWTVTAAGFVVAVSSLTWAVGAFVQGRVSTTAGRGRLAWAGPLVLAAGTLVTAGAALPGLSPWVAVPGAAVAGLGIGMVYPALTVLALRLTPAVQHGAVSASLQVADALGAATGLAVSGALVLALIDSGGTVAYLAGLLLATAVGLLATAAGARTRDR
ncbi:MFS transporter [Oceanitalea stevensii]|uniref:MFS transporter n=1 Tax=Oceanitalea stevensii TaxID=2763072 RepID=A0ABR8YYV4_9MICO|nr:MFS transporter [Oceanitalea stevensii]MBD8061248.1 MFS transporter [Oceanitalea stevensii]